MRFCVLTGDRPAALRQYDLLVELLEDEFGVGPMPETVALHRSIQDGRLPDAALAGARRAV